MKYKGATLEAICGMVAPLVGAWIEICNIFYHVTLLLVAPLVGAWIEILLFGVYPSTLSVAPLVGAWIEI